MSTPYEGGSETDQEREPSESETSTMGEKGIAIEEQTRHLVGKINNLITSDLVGMQEAWHVVDVRTCLSFV